MQKTNLIRAVYLVTATLLMVPFHWCFLQDAFLVLSVLLPNGNAVAWKGKKHQSISVIKQTNNCPGQYEFRLPFHYLIGFSLGKTKLLATFWNVWFGNIKKFSRFIPIYIKWHTLISQTEILAPHQLGHCHLLLLNLYLYLQKYEHVN